MADKDWKRRWDLLAIILPSFDPLMKASCCLFDILIKHANFMFGQYV